MASADPETAPRPASARQRGPRVLPSLPIDIGEPAPVTDGYETTPHPEAPEGTGNTQASPRSSFGFSMALSCQSARRCYPSRLASCVATGLKQLPAIQANPLFAHSPRARKPRAHREPGPSPLVRSGFGAPSPKAQEEPSRSMSDLKALLPTSPTWALGDLLPGAAEAQLRIAAGTAVALLLLLGFAMQHSARCICLAAMHRWSLRFHTITLSNPLTH